MTHSTEQTLAYAFDVRQRNTLALVGVGLVVPSHRYLAFVTERDQLAVTPELTAETWSALDAWVAEGNARLPERPAAMDGHIVGALLGADLASTVRAERFAAIPIPVPSRPELAGLVSRLLPELLHNCQSAA
jgi:hypothetical protein